MRTEFTITSPGSKTRTGGVVTLAKLSTHDDVLHAVSIPGYETHRWKEERCLPKLDGDFKQRAKNVNNFLIRVSGL